MQGTISHRPCTNTTRATSRGFHSLGRPFPAHFSPTPSRPSTQHHSVVVVASGFGKTKQKQTGGKKPVQQPSVAAPPSPSQGQATQLQGTAQANDLTDGLWNDILDDVEDFFNKAQRDVKAITLAAGRTLVLYKHQGIVYCSDVNSTAYQFPMADAKILARERGPAVEVPLEGTIYDLKTGKVLEWCPKTDNAVRNFFATLKRTQTPTPLPVFPTQVTPSGKLRVRLTALQ